jgi:2'-5' RNA ligase
MTDKMRLFIAFEIDDVTRAQLGEARGALQRVVTTAATPPRVTWVKDDAAHVTLRFIGETPAETSHTIQDALGAVTVSPFDVRWETVGTFGGMRRPRTIWVAPTAGTAECQMLVARINQQLDPLIGAGETRPFTPHLTIGRVRDPGRGVDWTHALAAVHWRPSVTRVERFVLYQSRLSPHGPTYTALSTHG